MNIAVINIKDLMKYALISSILLIVVISGIIIIKERERSVSNTHLDERRCFPFLYYLSLEVPMMLMEEDKKEENRVNAAQKILETQLAMMHNTDKDQNDEKQENEIVIENEGEVEQDIEEEIVVAKEELEITVIDENNIKAKYTDFENDIQINNQSKYDVKELLANANYELKNKEKVIIYHTHTCESYTPSEMYNYNMTGAYRTTDLKYTVAGVRR